MPITRFQKQFDAKHTLQILEKLIKSKKMKTTGFHPWTPPDLSWMLRVIIALDPSQEQHILNFRKVNITNIQENYLTKETIKMDPK